MERRKGTDGKKKNHQGEAKQMEQKGPPEHSLTAENKISSRLTISLRYSARSWYYTGCTAQ